MTWRDEAACVEHGGTTFMFPEEWDDVAVAKAKAVCRDCTVQVDCLTEEMRNEPDRRAWVGVRGGLATYERLGVRKPARRNAPGNEGPCNKSYSKHYRDGETPCDACMELHQEKERIRYAERASERRQEGMEAS